MKNQELEIFQTLRIFLNINANMCDNKKWTIVINLNHWSLPYKQASGLKLIKIWAVIEKHKLWDIFTC